MAKLILMRLEDRIVYDAAVLPVAEPAEPPAETAEAGEGQKEAGAPQSRAEAPTEDGAGGDSADVSIVPDEARSGDGDPAAPLFLEYPAACADDGAGLALPGDSPALAAVLGRLADVGESSSESVAADSEKDGSEAVSRPATDSPGPIDVGDGASIFDTYQVDGNFRNYMCILLELYKSTFDGDGFADEGRSPLHEYLIGGRLGMEDTSGWGDYNFYWLLDSGEKAYLLDCKVDAGNVMQLLVFRNNDGERVFRAAVDNDWRNPIDIPFMDVLDQLRFYSSPDDIESEDSRYSLKVTTEVDGSSSSENRTLSPGAPPPVEIPNPDVDNIGPGGIPPMDELSPGQPSAPEAPAEEAGGDEVDVATLDFDPVQHARIDELLDLEELPEDVRAEIEEIADLLGVIDDSEIPAARDVAASIVEFGETYNRFSKGVSRVLGMVAGLDGMERDSALAEWLGEVIKRGERLVGESSRHVSGLLQAIRDFKAMDASMRDSMAYARITGINAAMDGVNQEIRVIVAGMDMLSDAIAAMRGSGTAADVMALLPEVEEHMAAVAKDMRRLDGMRDSMYYVLQNAKALNGGG